MSKIITLSGKAEHGKDLTAMIMQDKLQDMGYDVCIIHMADYLKYIAKQFYGWDGTKDLKGRTLLQRLGTEKVRNINPNFWVNTVLEFIKVFEKDFNYFLIPDCRFTNEIETFKNEGFRTVALHIERLYYENHLTPEQRLHPSETSLDDYKFDYYIKTVSGTEYLKLEVDKFIKYIMED